MRKFLPLIIILVLFLCVSCTTKNNNSYVNQNNSSTVDDNLSNVDDNSSNVDDNSSNVDDNSSNVDDNLSNVDDNFKNNNNDNEITIWEDKNFEALIRCYLGNFDKDIYFKDLNNITDLEICSKVYIKTNIKECIIPKEDYDKIDLITSMKDIDNFNNLKKITLCCNKIETIHTHKNSSNLEYLDVHFNSIVDITNIAEYNNLTCFDISDNYIENLKPLENLTRLKELNLANIGSKADNIFGCIKSEIDIDDIDDLKNLENLNIEFSNLSNISKFNNLNNLIFLNLYLCGINEDELYLIPNYENNNLETLLLDIYDLSGEAIILDMNKLTSLNNLRSLGITGNPINLNSLKNLNKLYIGHAFIDKNENFNNLTNLKEISFDNVTFEDIQVLESLNNLESISFKETNIENLKYLKNNKNIKSISIINGNLSDISDLQLFNDVENLVLECNNITDISILTQLSNLKKIDIINNPILDYSVIEELKREGIQIFE